MTPPARAAGAVDPKKHENPTPIIHFLIRDGTMSRNSRYGRSVATRMCMIAAGDGSQQERKRQRGTLQCRVAPGARTH